jgi:sugar phosphate isomerase/epimerase
MAGMIRLCALLPAPDVASAIAMAQRLGVWGTGAWFPDEATQADAQALGRRFRDAGLQIVQVGCYQNLSTPVEGVRDRAVAALQRVLRLAAAAGARAVVTGAGHCDPSCPEATFAFHPDNYGEAALQRLADSCRRAAAAAEGTGVRLLLEPWVMTPLHTVERCVALLQRAGHPAIGIEFDPVNLMDLPTYREGGRFLERAVALLGPAIGLVHAKDSRLHPERFTYHMAEEPVGQGVLDYRALFGALARLPGDVPVAVEHVADEAAAAAALAHLRGVLAVTGEEADGRG